MNTLILPGFSPQNQSWAESVRTQLHLSGESVVSWHHWTSGRPEPDWVERETSEIIDRIVMEQVSLLAKSIGTLIAMRVIKAKPDLIHKVLLCGIPVNDFRPGNAAEYEILKQFSVNKCLCLQNRDDPHGSFDQAETLIHAVNPHIPVLSRPGQDHEYPYFDDFRSFLT
ncbi:MAG: hypothetical protein UX91_C0006G0183 [Candidatus Amesbacteria bacterium GW2011_GWB1_47_19]|nr:MAG: hypothetical protein UW51_C0002G0184 [Candidatus Amesbacteria bacterium GW2011_GWA1_44_24]KKU31225.1 MAG: hypothetical protein UX46_C0006G0017 [Candidatus Amesbacteria bacterium GW2011_GWC1_46_24]KKU67121.1 MAG: hypothetical protein UX91_C0006G0183 [Candidatus Amesbacteria bacterium GW2011_GWB1_47_19]OGD05477.1 MAG: hypothetical protein A2379_00775 [Candidatus Amesbacteria bacterium RIFOXYB1_FULL_47_13]HBC72991.1 hypothetical protein [Candidatus Amesbacteria bacterium]